MKLQYLFFTIILLSFSATAQTDTIRTLMHDGEVREYRLHLPPGYAESGNLPLILNFHGYGSNAAQQEFYSGMNTVSDNENFVVCYPDGLTDASGSTHFNVGFGGSDVDDVGFAAKLIDELVADYNLDADKVYSTGMSNGGFISFKLACEIGHKLAAIASVTGSMTLNEFENCEPMPIPVMQIHGTLDPTVPYDGGSFNAPIDGLVEFWATTNSCDETPTFQDIADIDTEDGSTAELYIYENGVNGNEVHFYKIIGGLHTWPGSVFALPGTNLDFNASEKIWKFFSQYSLPQVTSSNAIIANQNYFKVSPNPFTNSILVTENNQAITGLKLYNISGQLITQTRQNTLNTNNLISGIYFVEITDINGSVFQKVVKQ